MTEENALAEFNEGWAAGWNGATIKKNANATYKNAYNKGKIARKENDAWVR